MSMWFLAATMHFIHFLKVFFFLLIKSHKGAKVQKTHIEQLSYSLLSQSAAANKSSQRSHHHSALTADMCLICGTLFTPLPHCDHLISCHQK